MFVNYLRIGVEDLGRLNVVIADAADSYADSLADYLMLYHSHRFRVVTFSDTVKLSEYLGGPGVIDLLLVSQEIALELRFDKRQKCVAVLTEGRVSDKISGHRAINKYQPAEQLVTELLGIISESPDYIYTESCRNAPVKTYSFYASSDGCIRAVVSACLAAELSLRGLRTFFLSMEPLQPLELFFSPSSERGMSDAIFYVKQTDKSLQLKLESCRSTDGETGVSFFRPPESPADMEELNARDVSLIYETIKSSGSYDVIVVEIPVNPIERFVPVFSASDRVFVLKHDDAVCSLMTGTATDEIARVTGNDGLDSGKTITLYYGGDGPGGQGAEGRVPRINYGPDVRYAVRPGALFCTALMKAMESYI